jgi:hypothetical protein
VAFERDASVLSCWCVREALLALERLKAGIEPRTSVCVALSIRTVNRYARVLMPSGFGQLRIFCWKNWECNQ